MIKKKIIVGIDATNIRDSGGSTHLTELLKVTDPEKYGISKIFVWGRMATLNLLEDCPWLIKVNPLAQEKGLILRTLWQKNNLSKDARAFGCDILYIPGGSYYGDYHPVVSMSQNLLPYEFNELKRYGFSFMTIKNILLRFIQSKTFRISEGVIFLTNYAKKAVERIAGNIGNSVIIPHGLNDRFSMQPKIQYPIDDYKKSDPYKLLYVSKIEPYKHQWYLIEAIAKLRKETGWNIKLELVGPADSSNIKRLEKSMNKYDEKKSWIKYYGAIPFKDLHRIYKKADLGIFSSSCENMPNILLENMAAGLPIACSNRGPMPEILGSDGVYYDPENPLDIAEKIKGLIYSSELRKSVSNKSYLKSKNYTWLRCADETFIFLLEVYKQYSK